MFRKFSRNISWPVDMNMQMSELIDVIASQFSINSVNRKWQEISYFSFENVRLALIPFWMDA